MFQVKCAFLLYDTDPVLFFLSLVKSNSMKETPKRATAYDGELAQPATETHQLWTYYWALRARDLQAESNNVDDGHWTVQRQV